MAQRHKRQPVRIAATPDELAQRYRDGASLYDLAILFGCDSSCIRRVLVAHGVEIRPRGGGHGKLNRFIRRPL